VDKGIEIRGNQLKPFLL